MYFPGRLIVDVQRVYPDAMYFLWVGYNERMKRNPEATPGRQQYTFENMK
jgi:hypothetical protein